MSDRAFAVEGQAPAGHRATPTWLVVFQREATDLWIGGKGLTLVLIYSLLLGLWSYVMASNTDLKLIPPKEMVWEMLEATISVGCFIVMIAAADSISGDRERASLESILLTPTSRRQIVMGKFFAALSVWPAILVVTIPYFLVLSQGTDILVPAVMWGGFSGTILVVAIGALGMLISLWSNSQKTSMFVTLGLFVLIFMPFALPGHAQSGPMGFILQLLSPLMATYDFLAKVLVNNRALTDPSHSVGGLLVWHHLISPVFFAVAMVAALFFASPGLSLEASKANRWRFLRKRAPAAAASALLLLMMSLSVSPSLALETEPPKSPIVIQHTGQHVLTKGAPSTLEIAIDMGAKVVSQSDSILYKTTITNTASEPSLPLTVAMNIINLNAAGDVVDPEDWSPRRTQYIEKLAPGDAATLSWRVNAVMDGDFMVYMVAIPKPGTPDVTSQPITSSGIHLTVKPAVKLNPKGILLYVVGTPLLLVFGMVYLMRRRRRATDYSNE